MKKRAIHIFPRFENAERIHSLRQEFDPLAALIPPHLTLVYPFESDWTFEEVRSHCTEAVKGIKPFTMKLRGITGTREWHLFLNVKQGNDELIGLHDRLYSGLLQPFLYRKVTFVPHLTVGHFHNVEAFEAALAATEAFDDEFTCLVDEITVEVIEDDESSTVEGVVRL
ncbi:2'-5' RNA ligase family protein [Tumebacillus sp. ITR2]|uniref:2'-5' RNA ligase family protein n=1 Tax=Tumebacillus amylolyticus TaxID=2801339 RepID=A0ABS1JBP9_9BACL|nr:2'-5' RNA ligase family protein [Tumebacillus amylolyticus]MBL0387700.1 2'-5' RNA ligase family protein [Tumebacillus amylolyticus]